MSTRQKLLLLAFLHCSLNAGTCGVVAADASSAPVNVGWRNDGSGRFPDAKPPLRWGMDQTGKKENISWVTSMPSTSAASPIVVGDKVFAASADCDLVCVDKKTGKIDPTTRALWPLPPWQGSIYLSGGTREQPSSLSQAASSSKSPRTRSSAWFRDDTMPARRGR